MAHADLVPYRPAAAFLDRLKQYGLDFDHPRTLHPVPNREAERLLPSNSLAAWKARLASLFPFFLLLVSPGFASEAGLAQERVPPPDWAMVLVVLQALTLLLSLLGSMMPLLLWCARSQPDVLDSAKQTELGGSEPEVTKDLPSESAPEANRPSCATPRPEPADEMPSVKIPPRFETSPQLTSARPNFIQPKSTQSKRESPTNSVLIGGATRKGLVREENQDAFRVRRFDSHGGLLIVCDGVGGHPGGREASRFAAKYLMRLLSAMCVLDRLSPKRLPVALDVTQRAFHSRNLVGMTTAIVVWIEGNRLHYATLGDGDLVVIHGDGIQQSLLAPHHALGEPNNVITAYLSANSRFTPRRGSITLEPGCLILAMTDGVSELLPLEQIALHREVCLQAFCKQGVDQVCSGLLQQIELARDEASGALLHSDNMTLTMAALVPEPL